MDKYKSEYLKRRKKMFLKEEKCITDAKSA